MPAPHRPQVIRAILAKEELQVSSIASNARILAALPQSWKFRDYQKAQKRQEGNNSGILAIPEFWRIQNLARAAYARDAKTVSASRRASVMVEKRKAGQGGHPNPACDVSPVHSHRSLYAMPSEVSTSKPKRRVPVKPSCRQDEPKTKLTLYIAADLAKRFAVHATYSDMDKSELFAAMIREHCRRFVVSDRAKFPDEATGDVSA